MPQLYNYSLPMLLSNRRRWGMNRERWKLLPQRIEEEIISTQSSVVLGYKVNVTENIDTGELNIYTSTAPMTIPFDHKVPLRIVIKGASGSGKTFLTYRIMQQLVANHNLNPAIFLDPKSEMEPCENTEHPMMEGETPYSMNYRTYSPKFINAKFHGRQETEIGIGEFHSDELLAMYYSDKNIPAGVKDVVEDAMERAEKRYGNSYSTDALFQIIDDLEKINEVSRRSAKNVIKSLMRKKIISDKTNFSVMDDMANGICPILQYDMRHELYPHITSSFTSYLIRKLETTIGEHRGRHTKYSDLRPLMVIDESRLIAPPHPQNPPSKQALINCFGVTRGIGISMILTCLELRSLDKSILSQASYIITIGKLTTDYPVLKSFFDPQKVGITDEVCYFDVKAQRRIAALFDINSGKVSYFVPVPGATIPKRRK